MLASAGSSLNELSGLLSREREVLEKLLRQMGSKQPSDGLLNAISSLELHRAITVREAALELGFDGEPTLEEIAQRAPREWAAVLRRHRRALLSLVADVRALERPRVSELLEGGNVVTLHEARGVQRSLHDFLG